MGTKAGFSQPTFCPTLDFFSSFLPGLPTTDYCLPRLRPRSFFGAKLSLNRAKLSLNKANLSVIRAILSLNQAILSLPKRDLLSPGGELLSPERYLLLSFKRGAMKMGAAKRM